MGLIPTLHESFVKAGAVTVKYACRSQGTNSSFFNMTTFIEGEIVISQSPHRSQVTNTLHKHMYRS